MRDRHLAPTYDAFSLYKKACHRGAEIRMDSSLSVMVSVVSSDLLHGIRVIKSLFPEVRDEDYQHGIEFQAAEQH